MVQAPGPAWLSKAQRVAAGFKATSRGARGAGHSVYVVLLHNPQRDEPWGLYVGQTSRDPDLRFDQHKTGYKASRYVNRKSKKCLTAQPAAGSVVTEACGNLTFEKQWQWRADRLHSLIDHERYRMYVAGGQVLVSKKGRFPDFPANFSSPALEPWSNYPAAPRQGIDLIVGRAGTRPVPIGPEYAGLPAVTDDQRWRIEVLRQGL